MSNEDGIVADVVVEKAKKEATPTKLYNVAFNAVLEKTRQEVSEDTGTTPDDAANALINALYKPPATATKKVPDPLGIENTAVIDCETTGLDVHDSRIVLISVWPLKEDKAAIQTFGSMNEEEMMIEFAAYMNELKPEVVIGYNLAFDMLFINSRMIKYQIASNGLLNAKPVDLMDWCAKGTWKSGGTRQKVTSLENWAKYLLNEEKPYDIDTCFAAYEEGDIVPFYIRNRWDVAIEGDIYKLIKYVEVSSEYEEAPVVLKEIAGTQRQATGTADVQCPICKQVNVYDLEREEQVCFICGSILPKPKTKITK